MNRSELDQHLQELFDGRLEGQAFENLQQELRDDPAARAAYREHLHLQHALEFRTKGVDLLNVVPMDLVIERRQRRAVRTAGLAAVAVFAMGLLVAALVAARKPKPTLAFNSSPGTELNVSHALGGEDAPAGMVLEPGSRLTVISGTVELEFASGVRGIVRGPADLTLQREDLLELANGTAWFEVPADAVGFKVNTPDLILTDLGTEFGIISEPNFLDEVHVFDGKVEVRNRYGLQHTELLQAGQARYAGPAGRWQETPIRRDHFLDELPTKEIESSAQAIVLMDPTTNDGSFEAYPNGGFPGPSTLGVWTLDNPTSTLAGLWNSAPAGKDGIITVTANGSRGNNGVLNGTTSDLLTTGGSDHLYSTVSVGDEFSWSYIYNDGGASAQTVSYSIDFGNGPVVLDSFTILTSVGWLTRSDTYTATALDASGGQLSVKFSVEGHTYTDNYQLSVVPVP